MANVIIKLANCLAKPFRILLRNFSADATAEVATLELGKEEPVCIPTVSENQLIASKSAEGTEESQAITIIFTEAGTDSAASLGQIQNADPALVNPSQSDLTDDSAETEEHTEAEGTDKSQAITIIFTEAGTGSSASLGQIQNANPALVNLSQSDLTDDSAETEEHTEAEGTEESQAIAVVFTETGTGSADSIGQIQNADPAPVKPSQSDLTDDTFETKERTEEKPVKWKKVPFHVKQRISGRETVQVIIPSNLKPSGVDIVLNGQSRTPSQDGILLPPAPPIHAPASEGLITQTGTLSPFVFPFYAPASGGLITQTGTLSPFVPPFYAPALEEQIPQTGTLLPPVPSVHAPGSEGQIIKEEQIPKGIADKLIQKGILLKSSIPNTYLLNPIAAAFLNIDAHNLDVLAESDDENVRMHAALARCLYVNEKGELCFGVDGKLSMLISYLNRPSQRYASRANRLIEETYGVGLEVKNLECGVHHKSWGTVDLLTLKSHTTSAVCPCCGHITTEKCKESGSSSREVLDFPIHPGRPLIVRFESCRRYQCVNPECVKNQKHESFIEQFSCLTPNQQRTNRVNALLVVSLIDGNFHGCERAMGLVGIRVGDDSLRKLILSIHFADDPNITAIGVDDIADRKGVSYFTVIYALEDHRLLTILNGRDGVELQNWLDKHLSVRLICRDRASAYATHIDEWARIHNVCVEQVADRFHIIKNYIDHLREICYAYLPKRIAFDKNTGVILDTIPNKVAQPVMPKPDEETLNSLDYDNTPKKDENGNPVDVPISASSDSDNTDAENQTVDVEPTKPKTGRNGKKTKQQQKKEEAQQRREEKYALACKVRKEFDPSGSKMEQYKTLAEKYGIKESAVQRYIGMTPEEVEALREVKPREVGPRVKEIDDYKNIIYKMILDGIDVGTIFWYVKLQKNYSKSDSNLMGYILEIYRFAHPKSAQPRMGKYIKLDYPDDVVVITRNAILKYLVTVNPKTPKNQYLTDHEEEFFAKYPKAKQIRDAFLEFHGVIMGDSVEDLEKLCSKPCALPELDSFFKHLLNEDMAAVSNAIRYSYSSGFVEGNNNRLKTTKRASYGRLRLAMLIQKCMLAFTATLDNFELGHIVKWVPLRDDPSATDDYLDTLTA